MLSAAAIATKKKKKKGSADKPANTHLCCFNLIYNYVNIIVIMYF